ncbi:MAG: 3'-5' exonuclease [Desulfocucumaceae bacterium]
METGLVLKQVDVIKKLFPLFNKEGRQPDSESARKLEKFRELVKKNDYRQKDNLCLREMRLVVLDTETTGLRPQAGDEIISIGACCIENNQITSEMFHRLVNPNRPISPFITELTGINDEMVANAEDFCSVMNDFLEFLKDSLIIGHSIDFDVNFMNYKLKPYNFRVNNFHIDTGMISRALNPHLKIHTLDSLLSNLDIEPEGRHTALGDALLTAGVFIKFFERLEHLKIFTLWDLRCYIRNAIMYRL